MVYQTATVYSDVRKILFTSRGGEANETKPLAIVFYYTTDKIIHEKYTNDPDIPTFVLRIMNKYPLPKELWIEVFTIEEKTMQNIANCLTNNRIIRRDVGELIFNLCHFTCDPKTLETVLDNVTVFHLQFFRCHMDHSFYTDRFILKSGISHLYQDFGYFTNEANSGLIELQKLPYIKWNTSQEDDHTLYKIGRRIYDDRSLVTIFQPHPDLVAGAHVSGFAAYQDMYNCSINDPGAFWKTVAAELFEKPSFKGLEYNFDAKKGKIFCKFMDGARTNIAYNCLERNIKRGFGDKVAYFWEGNESADSSRITYNELLAQVINFSAVLRAHGVKRGDVVAIYMPMVTELAVAMLACARIGALHSVVFAGFSAESLSARIVDASCNVIVTADGFYRGAKTIDLKTITDRAVQLAAKNGVNVTSLIMVEHVKRVTQPQGAIPPKAPSWNPTDFKYAEEMSKYANVDCPVEWMEAESPLFLLYTSGSTGKPKGIQHTTAGYMTYAYFTMKCTFDAHPENDIYWCTADMGWITGHSYLLYGPLLNGVTGVWFEGIPTHPTPARMWEIVDKYLVTKLYTSPTTTRSLMSQGKDWVLASSRKSLKILATAGEPINPAAWKWLYSVVGEGRCGIVDTYWQTETGGHMLTPMPGSTPTKPGSATMPFFGVSPVLLDGEGRVIEGPGEGNLCFDRAWPGMMRGVYGDEERLTYFAPFNGYYFTGDGARRDEDGYLWVTGRVDDLMNVSGHLLSTAEIESALVAHPKVAEAAVVAAPHDIKGSFPYAFVTLNKGEKLDKALVAELKVLVRQKIGAIAVPDVIQEALALPKTRSGKVTRRILRKIAEGSQGGFGDITTLLDESVIKQLISGRIRA